ncbi:hypothetical protein BGZ61DRAFT_76786 [Ilyonectria robusta]|uniref:uncharacterized protein n=1 Tax=Ilyonectria robusta TaxID=1079257 RepID=UPI001E8E423A|nr:uncharacterized protein BGZ61DRAFT_76786 [Ilyonectria robusta]KAH8677238.1 hypothetical protein BGZ61DRAFT_76786 [Ilyonectria robusta]
MDFVLGCRHRDGGHIRPREGGRLTCSMTALHSASRRWAVQPNILESAALSHMKAGSHPHSFGDASTAIANESLWSEYMCDNMMTIVSMWPRLPSHHGGSSATYKNSRQPMAVRFHPPNPAYDLKAETFLILSRLREFVKFNTFVLQSRNRQTLPKCLTN